MRREVVQVICLWAIVLSANPLVRAVEFAGGTGEPNNPYLIATAEQLLAADFSVPGIYFRLSRDIDLDRNKFGVVSFRAHLDGDGFAVRNGLYAMAGGPIETIEQEGTIANLTWADFEIGSASVKNFGPIGGLVGWNFGTISNCAAIGWIATWRIQTVGGLVGDNRGSIVNCYFDGWVGSDWDSRLYGEEYLSPHIGGLVGYNSGSIVNSFTRGFVVGSTGLGGLVGLNGGTINNCYSTCMVIGDAGAGGLVNENWGSLRNCYAAGEVTGEMRGGLVGMAGHYWYLSKATGCLWDTRSTNCLRSGAGIASAGLSSASETLARNGWAGDPNWVIMPLPDWTGLGPNEVPRDEWDFYLHHNYPRLAWEGAPGEIVPASIWPLFREGSGTQSDPYVIRTTEALLSVCHASIYWDKHFVLAQDLNLWGNMEFMSFSPIGTNLGSSFSGTFDGNGHVIRNLGNGVTDDDGESTAWNFALFGYVTGEVRNLALEGFRFTGGMRCRGMGLLAGVCAGVIKNCSATGSITVGENSRYIGELVGVNFGEISDCTATVTIEAGEGSTDVGGLTGADHPLP